MNLKELAAATGISYATAHWRHGARALPVPTNRRGQLIMVGEPLTGASPHAAHTVVYAQVSSADQGRRLLMVRPVEVNDGPARDVTEILTSLCTRLFGSQAAADRGDRVAEVATGDDPR